MWRCDSITDESAFSIKLDPETKVQRDIAGEVLPISHLSFITWLILKQTDPGNDYYSLVTEPAPLTD